MTDITARLKTGKLSFETMVDLDSAIKLRRGEKVDVSDVIRDNVIWTDLKKGMKAGRDELMNAFGTTEFNKIVERIVTKGEIEVTQEYRDEALENRKKQIIDFLNKNAIDARTGRPFTPDILESAIREAGVKIENQPADKQIKRIMEGLNKIIPIKIESIKVKLKIPAIHTGKVYGIINDYKEKETWLSNGDLDVLLNVPAGMRIEFYDKLNKVTHGSAIAQEVKE